MALIGLGEEMFNDGGCYAHELPLLPTTHGLEMPHIPIFAEAVITLDALNEPSEIPDIAEAEVALDGLCEVVANYTIRQDSPAGSFLYARWPTDL